jgi:hypothetical protein
LFEKECRLNQLHNLKSFKGERETWVYPDRGDMGDEVPVTASFTASFFQTGAMNDS